jgi:hypothetical protein
MLSWATSLLPSRSRGPPRVTDIFIYPIKSCGKGLRLETADFLETGFRHDRQWMIVEADSLSMLTARQLPLYVGRKISEIALSRAQHDPDPAGAR